MKKYFWIWFFLIFLLAISIAMLCAVRKPQVLKIGDIEQTAEMEWAVDVYKGEKMIVLLFKTPFEADEWLRNLKEDRKFIVEPY
jgi:hypothetical protein